MSHRNLASVLLVLGMLATTNAFASRARLAVMGTSDPLGGFEGTSFFYDDNLNIFQNPSYINDFKNWASVEKVNDSGSGAEGGFVTSFMNLNLGIYLNRSANIGTGFAPYTAAANFRPVDITVGGDMGVKWGLGLTYGGAKVAGTDSAHVTLRGGVQIASFEPFFHFNVKGEDKTAGVTTELDNFRVGTRYRWGEWVPFAAASFSKVKAAGAEAKNNLFGVGLGRNTKLTDGMKFNYALAFWRGLNTNRNVVPLDFNIETSLASWITGRAGLSHNVWDRTGQTTTAVATTGRLGATFNFGKANLDWAVGGAAGGVDSATFDLANGFFTAASLTYTW